MHTVVVLTGQVNTQVDVELCVDNLAIPVVISGKSPGLANGSHISYCSLLSLLLHQAASVFISLFGKMEMSSSY